VTAVARTTKEQAVATRVLVVDDHRTFAQLLAILVDGQSDLTCVGTSFTAEEAQEFCLGADPAPDVAVVDIDLKGGDGLALTEWLGDRFPQLRVVVLAGHATADIFARASGASASALVPKESAVTHIVEAIRVGTRATMWAPPELVEALRTTDKAAEPRGGELTPREHEVLTLLAEGLSVQQISRQLGLSIHTTRGYVKTLLAKLEAHSQLEAVIVAARRGLISAVV
jgi:DNA-binding NarL/FixJ family response regulator